MQAVMRNNGYRRYTNAIKKKNKKDATIKLKKHLEQMGKNVILDFISFVDNSSTPIDVITNDTIFKVTRIDETSTDVKKILELKKGINPKTGDSFLDKKLAIHLFGCEKNCEERKTYQKTFENLNITFTCSCQI